MNGRNVKETVLSPITLRTVLTPTTTLCSKVVSVVLLPILLEPIVRTPLRFHVGKLNQPPKKLRPSIPKPVSGTHVLGFHIHALPEALILAEAVPLLNLPSLIGASSSVAVLLITFAGLYFV